MSNLSLRVITYREGDSWIAQCVDYDICAQANDMKTLMRRFDATVTCDYEQSLAAGGEPFAGIPPAPKEIVALWEECNPKFEADSFGRKNTYNLEVKMVA